MTTSTADVLARAFADLESAYALAWPGRTGRPAVPAGEHRDELHLAAAGLSRYLSEPLQAAEHADCLTALHAAQQELLSLDVEHGLSLVDFTLVRSRVGSALAVVESLPR